MGEWGFASFVRCEDLDALETELTRLCAAEGYLPERWWKRKRQKWDPMQFGTGETSPRWAVAIGRGLNGWSVIRTAPQELLAEPSTAGEHVPRMGTLARALRTDALHVSLYDGVGLLVAETTAEGAVSFSGSTLSGPDFHGIILSEDRAEPRIERVTVPPPISKALSSGDVEGFRAVVEGLAGDMRWDELLPSLIEGKRAPIPGARVLWFNRDISRFKRVAPLRVGLSIEEHPLTRRIVLRSGKGEMWLNEASIDAPDAERGARFVDAVAVWLGQKNDRRLGGAPRSDLAFVEASSERSTRVGFESLLVNLGERSAGQLLLHLAPSAGYAELEEVSPITRGRIVRTLRDALEGTGAPDAVFDAFTRIASEPTGLAHGCFSGNVPVVGVWRLGRSALYVEEREHMTFDGLVTAIAGWEGGVALNLVTPEDRMVDDGDEDDPEDEGERPRRKLQGYGDHTPARIVVVDLATRTTREILRSTEALRFGSTQLIASPDGAFLAVSIFRVPDDASLLIDLRTSQVVREVPGTPVLWDRDGLLLRQTGEDFESPSAWFRWTVGDSDARSVPGTFVSPDGKFVVRHGEVDVHSDYRIACLFSGPHEVVLENNRALDLQTKAIRRLMRPDGMEPVAFTVDGTRCLGKVDDRRYYVGRRTPSRET